MLYEVRQDFVYDRTLIALKTGSVVLCVRKGHLLITLLHDQKLIYVPNVLFIDEYLRVIA